MQSSALQSYVPNMDNMLTSRSRRPYKLIFAYLVNKFFSLYGKRKFITTVTSGRHRTPYCANKFSPTLRIIKFNLTNS